MLRVAKYEDPFAAPGSYDEFVTDRLNGDEGNAAVIVLARCDGAAPLAEIKHGRGAFLPDVYFTKGATAVVCRELRHLLRIGRYNQPFA